MIELTDIQSKAEAEPAISAAWPAEPHYRGKSVFESIYGYGQMPSDGRSIEAAVVEADLLPDEYQECYLGYLPEEDAFVIGFDAWASEDEWEDSSDRYGIFKVKVHADGTMGVVTPIEAYGCGMFYGTGPGRESRYAELRRDFPGLINMRLD